MTPGSLSINVLFIQMMFVLLLNRSDSPETENKAAKIFSISLTVEEKKPPNILIYTSSLPSPWKVSSATSSRAAQNIGALKLNNQPVQT